MPYRHTLRFGGRWLLARGGTPVERFPRGTHLELDDTGTLLTILRPRPTAAEALDLRTGETWALSRTCRVGAERGRVRFELCGYPWGPQPATIVRVERSRRDTLVGPAERSFSLPRGWWRSVALSRDGKYLLAERSGECETPSVFLIDTGRPRLLALGGDRAGRAVEGRALGWSGDKALVAFPRSVCASSIDRPGVYGFGDGRTKQLILSLPLDPRTDVRLCR